ncbi:hypothetical protein DNTS_029365 [Danionella cerebrum]|uniref:DAN domain-containing protein n=1 Tax=Danionella cerebrum TaxID=2873325 RepID=A0A553Q7X7_9TELE|nr:hypothetical protein DNTS_029365 [Danionella translucida]
MYSGSVPAVPVTVMCVRALLLCALLRLGFGAPHSLAHIDRLALFPDKSAWCEAKNITQIVGHDGCMARSVHNRVCLGQCFSYSVPNTFPQSTESLCEGALVPRVDKLVELIRDCSCQSCSRESAQEPIVFPPEQDTQPLDSAGESEMHSRDAG